MPSPLPLRAQPPPPENGGESYSEPPVKKQKINEELTTLDDEGEIDSSRFGTLDPLTVSPGPSEDCKRDAILFDMQKEWYKPLYPGDILGDDACRKRYFQQINESEGFDIKDFPGYAAVTTIHPFISSEEIKGFAAQALELYNEDNMRFSRLIDRAANTLATILPLRLRMAMTRRYIFKLRWIKM